MLDLVDRVLALLRCRVIRGAFLRGCGVTGLRREQNPNGPNVSAIIFAFLRLPPEEPVQPDNIGRSDLAKMRGGFSLRHTPCAPLGDINVQTSRMPHIQQLRHRMHRLIQFTTAMCDIEPASIGDL